MIFIEELKKKTTPNEKSEIGRRLLSKGLMTEYGIADLPHISFGEHGKPFFPSCPDIRFNISHCDRAVACVLSDREIGIDVESINEFDREIAEFISMPSELETILKSPDPELAFVILWTKKESYCKLTGKGLEGKEEIQRLLADNPAVFQTIINEAGGYVITVCRYK